MRKYWDISDKRLNGCREGVRARIGIRLTKHSQDPAHVWADDRHPFIMRSGQHFSWVLIKFSKFPIAASVSQVMVSCRIIIIIIILMIGSDVTDVSDQMMTGNYTVL